MAKPPPTLEDLGRAIRRMRRDRGWTIDELADRSGIHTTYLSRIERARSNATWMKLAAVAEAFGLRPSDIARAAENESDARRKALDEQG